jgi:DNA-binding response OmpR family regulator
MAHILVVDDEPAIRLTLQAVLQRAGHHVTTAERGDEALACIERQPVDLVLLDLIMPGMSGLEVAGRLRERRPAITVLILTGSDILHGRDLADYHSMLKTADPRDVLERVAALLAPPIEGMG